MSLVLRCKDSSLNRRSLATLPSRQVTEVFPGTPHQTVVRKNSTTLMQRLQGAMGVYGCQSHSGIRRPATRWNPEQVVGGMLRMSEAGVDRITVSWVHYLGLAQFREQILPLMIRAGLRYGDF
jgi:hypothetical protein